MADDIVIIVGSALVISGAISRSGITDVALRGLKPERRGPRTQLLILVAVVALLSAFVKNIGALAIMIPVAMQMARASNVSPSMFLMPMSFASLLGGLMTQIGTSPNIIVSRVREEITGAPFTMFDYTPAIVGLLFLVFCYKLLPARSSADRALHEAVAIKNYTTEAAVTEQTLAAAGSVGALQKFGSGNAMIIAIIGEGGNKRAPLPDNTLKLGDALLLEGEQEALDKIVSQGKLKLKAQGDAKPASTAETGAVEAIVGENSRLIGNSAKDLYLLHNAGLSVLALSRRGQRFVERLGDIKIRNGDVLVLQGHLKTLPDLLREWDCLPLVQRDVRLGSVRNGIVPIAILALAMAGTAFGGVPVAAAFFAAAFLIVVTGAMPLRDVYSYLDAPILIMLAALIPVSDALRTTGTTDVIAGLLSTTAAVLPPYGALALILIAAMAVTPFLNNAATVLVMAPIAATFADKLGFAPDAFLMAVAIGAGCDFLTPIGHQCNTLVMGPGGYRFGDYWRLGLPLSLLVIAVAVPMLLLVWSV
ncbi:SLC13 family permease [Rhizobium sp. TH2]|uniref:SLC13 family permease n=1 Tax=Rhizobium sp. TH2 TaxID=2775403 RepID=UPI002157C5F7|nr:SLC13 family permease [Rhizobium sp. TH2]